MLNYQFRVTSVKHCIVFSILLVICFSANAQTVTATSVQPERMELQSTGWGGPGFPDFDQDATALAVEFCSNPQFTQGFGSLEFDSFRYSAWASNYGRGAGPLNCRFWSATIPSMPDNIRECYSYARTTHCKLPPGAGSPTVQATETPQRLSYCPSGWSYTLSKTPIDEQSNVPIGCFKCPCGYQFDAISDVCNRYPGFWFRYRPDKGTVEYYHRLFGYCEVFTETPGNNAQNQCDL